jgi:hypothetical protein
MSLFLITRSAHHYPLDGIGDWVGLYDHVVRAETEFRDLMIEPYESACLIQIEPNGHYAVLDERDGGTEEYRRDNGL